MNLLRYDAMVKRAGGRREARWGLPLPLSPWVLGLFLPFLARCRFFSLTPPPVPKVATEKAVGNAKIVAKGRWAGEEKGSDLVMGSRPN